jgi:hypothetical protein
MVNLLHVSAFFAILTDVFNKKNAIAFKYVIDVQ